MFDAQIINEAYDELNEEGLAKIAPEEKYEDKRDPKIERIRKLVSDIQGILYKIEDSAYDQEFGKEDDDIRDEMKKSLTKTMVKMVDRLKEVVGEDPKKKDKEEDKEEDSKDEESEDEEDDDEEDKEDKEEDKEETEKELEKNSKEEIVSQIMKLFPTESVKSPQGKEYAIVEINEEKSLLKDIASGENFKIDTNILRKWKNN